MLSASAELHRALNQDVTLRAAPTLTIEWNQNRYAGIETIDSTPLEKDVSLDAKCFPVASLVEANRPKQGIVKGFVADDTTSMYWRQMPVGYENNSTAERGYLDSPPAVRTYTVGEDTPYKYWVSPYKTAPGVVNGVYPFAADQHPTVHVFYKKYCWSNKIVVGFESSWSRPTTFSIQVTLDNNTWQTIATNPLINSEGQVIIYRQANGSWAATPYLSNPLVIKGVRVVVSSMDKPEERLHMIEMSARLESDLTDYLISYSSEYTMDEPNFITPIGRASSNTGSITLSNETGLFNPESATSLYGGLIDQNAEVRVDMVYSLPNGTTEVIRQLTMYTDTWSGGDGTVSVSLRDFSKFFQEQKPTPFLLEEVTVGEAIWRLCDLVGFNNYIYDKDATEESTQIPYFWADGEETVWSCFQGLAEATQTAVYFDELGRLRIKTRDAAYKNTRNIDWAFEAVDRNGKLANIISADVSQEYEANTVNIVYKNTRISDYQQGWPKMEVIWQPAESLVLRASKLTRDLYEHDEYVSINGKDALTWPYDGVMNVQGEFIRYEGKEYTYYNQQGGQTVALLLSSQEKENIDKNLSDEYRSYLNSFTGRMKVKKRGEFGSRIKTHSVRHNNYSSRHFWWNDNNSSYSWGINGGIIANPNDSTITLATNHQFEGNRILAATTTTHDGQVPMNLGTRFRFPPNGQHGRGVVGLVFNSGAGDSGYYVEIVRSETLNANAGMLRNYTNEITFFTRGYDGSFTRHGGTGAIPVTVDEEGKGTPFLVADEVWYDLDVEFRYGNPSPLGGFTHEIYIYLNGVRQLVVKIAGGRVTPTNRFGMWTRGNTRVDFDYLYAHSALTEDYRTDDLSTYDKIKGGYASGGWQTEAIYGAAGGGEVAGSLYFDEFGPVAHEVREMEVKFEKSPVVHSRFWTSNDRQILIPEYTSTPFGATFVLANSSRENAIASGEDKITFGAENPVDQQTMIYGRLVYQEDEETETIVDDEAVRRRGKVEVDISNPWIQNEAEAKSLGEWITKHWGGGADEVELEVFGNPLIQIGDLATVHHPRMDMNASTHRYFVVGTSSNFEDGFTTSVTLRRSKI